MKTDKPRKFAIVGYWFAVLALVAATVLVRDAFERLHKLWVRIT